MQLESALERNSEHSHVQHIGVPLSQNPEVMSKDYAREQVNDVVSSQENHECKLTDQAEHAEAGHPFPTIPREFTEVDHAASNVTRKKEIICFPIRD